MITMLLRLFGRRDKRRKPNDFHRFVTEAASGEHVKALRQIVRKADEDQLDLVKRYEQRFAKEHNSAA